MQVTNKNFPGLKIKIPAQLLEETITCVDSHTGGEPTRLVIGGMPLVKGNTIREKKQYFTEHYDHLRTTLTGEPRAHAAMHAAIYLPPCTEETDFGLLFTCALGNIDMCGHALIGSVVSGIEAGVIIAEEPETKLIIETPAGIMKVTVHISKGKVENVTFRNQPSFAYKCNLELDVVNLTRLKVDIAFGGNWYVIVDSSQVGIDICVENLPKFAEATKNILATVNSEVEAKHPDRDKAEKIKQLLFMAAPTNPAANGKNLVTSLELGFDRSPCGTGSCAKMSLLYARGELNLNEKYVHESGIVGTMFSSQLVEAQKVGEFDAVVPEITGTAYITSVNQIIIDPRDPLKHGFYIS